MTFEWLKCLAPPRTSQMPSSGSRQMVSRWRTSACSSVQLVGVLSQTGAAGDIERVNHFAEHVELQLLTASLPTRTGFAPS